MKKGLLRFLYGCIVLGASVVSAQNKELLYDFTEIPQSLLLNPGEGANYNWYAGIPILSGFSLQAGSNAVSVADIFANDGVDINQKVRNRLLDAMDIQDELSGSFQLDILNGGFRGRNERNFYSFGLYLEGDAIGYWFKDLAILGFDGNAPHLGRRFDLSHLKTRGELVSVWHFGVNKRVDDHWTVGARAKLYSGIFNFNSTHNKGYFRTLPGENNFYANTLVADMQLQTSGIWDILDAGEDGRPALSKSIAKKILFGGNLGLGADFGFSYRWDEQHVLTGSVLDLGFMVNSKDVRTFNLNGSDTEEGIELIFPGDVGDANRDYWQELVDRVEELVPFEEDQKSYVTFRPAKFHASYRYDFGKAFRSRSDCDCDDITSHRNLTYTYANAAGLQWYAIARPRGPQMALTAFYLHRFGNIMALKGTYTVDKFSKTNLGLGVNAQLGKMEAYFLVDNLLSYGNLADAHYASLQIGINILSW